MEHGHKQVRSKGLHKVTLEDFAEVRVSGRLRLQKASGCASVSGCACASGEVVSHAPWKLEEEHIGARVAAAAPRVAARALSTRASEARFFRDAPSARTFA